MGQEFSTQERATDVFVKRDGRWQCVLTHLTDLRNERRASGRAYQFKADFAVPPERRYSDSQ